MSKFSIIFILSLFVIFELQPERLVYELKTKDNIQYRYVNKKTIDVNLDTIPKEYSLTMDNFLISIAALPQLKLKSDWQRLTIILNSARTFDCSYSENIRLCYYYKKKAIEYYATIKAHSYREFENLESKLHYGLVSYSGRYYLKLLYKNISLQFPEAFQVMAYEEKSSVSTIMKYYVRSKNIHGTVYLERFTKLYFSSVDNYAKLWSHRNKLLKNVKWNIKNSNNNLMSASIRKPKGQLKLTIIKDKQWGLLLVFNDSLPEVNVYSYTQ